MSVNIVNPQDVASYLLEQAEGDSEIAFWLETSIGKSIRVRAQNAEAIRCSSEKLRHFMVSSEYCHRVRAVVLCSSMDVLAENPKRGNPLRPRPFTKS